MLETLCKLQFDEIIVSIEEFTETFSENIKDTQNHEKTTQLIILCSNIYTCVLEKIKSEKELYQVLYDIIVNKLDTNADFLKSFIEKKSITDEITKKVKRIDGGGRLFSFFTLAVGILTLGIISESRETNTDTFVNTMAAIKDTPSLAPRMFNSDGICVSSGLIMEMVCDGIPNPKSREVATFYENIYGNYTRRQHEHIGLPAKYNYRDLGIHSEWLQETTLFNSQSYDNVQTTAEIKAAYSDPSLAVSSNTNLIVSGLSYEAVDSGHFLNLYVVFEKNEKGGVDPNSLKVCVSDVDLMITVNPSKNYIREFSNEASIFCEKDTFTPTQLQKLGTLVQVVDDPLVHYTERLARKGAYFKFSHFQSPSSAVEGSNSGLRTGNTQDLVEIFDNVHTQIVAALYDASNEVIAAGGENAENAQNIKDLYQKRFSPSYKTPFYQPYEVDHFTKSGYENTGYGTGTKVAAAAAGVLTTAAILKMQQDEKRRKEATNSTPDIVDKGGRRRTKRKRRICKRHRITHKRRGQKQTFKRRRQKQTCIIKQKRNL